MSNRLTPTAKQFDARVGPNPAFMGALATRVVRDLLVDARLDTRTQSVEASLDADATKPTGMPWVALTLTFDGFTDPLRVIDALTTADASSASAEFADFKTLTYRYEYPPEDERRGTRSSPTRLVVTARCMWQGVYEGYDGRASDDVARHKALFRAQRAAGDEDDPRDPAEVTYHDDPLADIPGVGTPAGDDAPPTPHHPALDKHETVVTTAGSGSGSGDATDGSDNYYDHIGNAGHDDPPSKPVDELFDDPDMPEDADTPSAREMTPKGFLRAMQDVERNQDEMGCSCGEDEACSECPPKGEE